MSFQRAVSALLAAGMLWCVAAPSVIAQDNTQYVNFSFDQVDIRLLVKLVGDMTGKRFVVDDNVTGKITLVTPPRIPIEEVYPLFLSIIESSGYSVVDKDGIYQVVSLENKTTSGAPVVGENDTGTRSGIITKVLKLENVSAVDIKKTLEPLVRGGTTGAMEAFAPSNHLIITDTAENIRRIEHIIRDLDRPGASRVVEFIALDHASADEISAQIIMALKGAESSNKAISRHIKKVAGGSGALPVDVVIVPATQANGLVLVGTSSQLRELQRIVKMMDVESESGYGRLNAIFLKYLPAEEAAKSLNALLAKSTAKEDRQRIAIEPSAPNNALIVDAAPQDFQYVKQLVEQLDQVPQQVMVEILIAEVTMGKNLDLGVEWASIQVPEDGKTVPIGRSRPDEEDTIMNYITEGVFPQGLSLGVAAGTYVDANGVLQPRIPFLIKALAEDRDVKILSDVPLRAQNNTEASISVVDNIPILTSVIEGGAGTARDVIQNIERMDVGLKLKFTPHVNPDREITMQLNPVIEAITDEGPADKDFTPTISKREVFTTVTVPDKSTIIISGLIREDQVTVVSKVPLLGDIPLLGWLFRSTQERKQRTNLLIFVTPHIVTEPEEAAAFEADLIERSGLNISRTNVSMRTEQTERK